MASCNEQRQREGGGFETKVGRKVRAPLSEGGAAGSSSQNGKGSMASSGRASSGEEVQRV